MAIKGTESKNYIFSKLQNVFPGSFWEDEGKILRIPLEENGARIEVKVTLTAAKTNLGGEDIPSAFQSFSEKKIIENSTPDTQPSSVSLEPTEEEKENVSKLIAVLGL